MDSATKAVFPRETIEALVRAQFGSASRIVELTPLTAGWFNTAYAIRLDNLKPDVVLRIAPHPEQRVLAYERDLMRREIAILEQVQSVEDVPVPRLMGYDFSRSIIDRDCMFSEMLSGVPYNEVRKDLPPEVTANVDREIGRAAARMAEIVMPSFGYPHGGPGDGSPTWRGGFLAMMDALLADGEVLGAVVPLPWSELRALIGRHAPALDDIITPSLVHWDLWAGNIFVKPEDGTYVLEAIIDWERVLWGDPDIETAVACGFYGAGFYEGYGRTLSETGSAAVRQSLYRLYLWLIMTIEAKVRFEDADHLPWVRERLVKELAWLEAA